MGKLVHPSTSCPCYSCETNRQLDKGMTATEVLRLAEMTRQKGMDRLGYGTPKDCESYDPRENWHSSFSAIKKDTEPMIEILQQTTGFLVKFRNEKGFVTTHAAETYASASAKAKKLLDDDAKATKACAGCK